MDKVERLFFILTTIQQNPGVTAPELAKLSGTSLRNIYRDIKQLDEAGIQITLKSNKGYFIVDNMIQTPARLAPEEYLAISLYPILAGHSQMGEYPLQSSFKKAMEKILTRFRVNDDVIQLSKRIRIHSSQMTPDQEQVMQKVIESILREVTITTTYYTMSREELTTRMIDPYYLVPRMGHLYLIGFCHERDGIRTFRLNRFQTVELTEKKFFMLDDFNIDMYLANLWGITADAEEVTFKVRFSKKVARYIKEERYESNPSFIDQGDGSLLLEVTVRGTEEFLRWVKQFGKDAEVLEPAEYRQKLLDEIQEIIRIYYER